jgi:hypothetical protein
MSEQEDGRPPNEAESPDEEEEKSFLEELALPVSVIACTALAALLLHVFA